MISILIISSLSAFWLWNVASQLDPPLWGKWRDRLVDKSPLFDEFISCPWCSGAWIALATTLATSYAMIGIGWETPMLWLAAASIVGLIGSYDSGDPV